MAAAARASRRKRCRAAALPALLGNRALRATFRCNGRLPFTQYACGKSAARVTDAVQPSCSHTFTAFEGLPLSSRAAWILHYPAATFDRWRRKYELRGEFSDRWPAERRSLLSREQLYHEHSRDLYARCAVSGNFEEAEQWFRTTVLPNQGELEREVHRGNAFQVFDVAQRGTQD